VKSLRNPARRTWLAILLSLCMVAWLASAGLAQEHGAPAEGHGEAATAEHGGGGGEHGGGMDKRWDYIKRVMNFGLLAALLVFLLRKPIADFFGGRRQQISQQLADLERARDEAKAQLKEYEAKLSQAAAERERILSDFVAQGEAEKAKIIEEGKRSAERLQEAARMTIEAELKAAKLRLREEMAESTVRMAEEMLRKTIKPADHERLVGEYLAKVVDLK